MIAEKRSELMGKGNVQVGSAARIVSVQVSEEKNKRCEKDRRDRPSPWLVSNRIQKQSRPCTPCVDVDSNRDFRHIPRRCLSLQLILVKNMQRHARSGTSLQL